MAAAAEPAVLPSNRGDRRPDPDPSNLTTANLVREVKHVRELLEAQLQGLKESVERLKHEVDIIPSERQREVHHLKALVEGRFDGMDKAIELIQANADKVPSDVDLAIGRLQELHAEKFKGVATQFSERDTRTEQTSKDNKVAIDAALQAQKEAVGKQNESNALAIAKQETAFTKQIDAIGALITTTTKSLEDKIFSMTKALDDKIDDMKGRLNGMEGHSKGSSDLWGFIVGGIGVVAIVVAMVLSLKG